eukprot:CAMPEP_0116129738 /NCGR_PEP_ID=MMETSP0329-20121206/8077_1 /TAXON_ID=697910 /ORGANISM="Pseudo-nitzschia arenysensis, Strain B593" /LENGTH=952 /DNA_ID=CAMNT_0003624011 /DNA_START=74 /DNA_END=2932 /DNA_ORIENTATION=-
MTESSSSTYKDTLERSLKGGRSESYNEFVDELKLKQKHRLYGDFINAMFVGVAAPAMAYKIYTEKNADNFDAFVMVGSTALSAILQGLAWKYDSMLLSRAGFFGNCFAGSFMEVKEWPIKGVCTVTHRFQVGVIALCIANISLSVREQAIRLLTIFAVGSYVSIQSPYSVYTEDALPGLGGAVIAAFFVLYLYQNSASIKKNFGGVGTGIVEVSYGLFNIQVQKDELLVQTSRLVLAAMYTHLVIGTFYGILITVSKVDDDARKERVLGGFKEICKATVIASVSLVATGVFQTKIDQKEQLEIMVWERTKELRLKNIELRMINFAFKASETAIAITDASRTVIWTNHAFETMSKKTKGSVDTVKSCVDQQLTDVILLDNPVDETKLRGAFDFSTPRQDEIEIQGDGEAKSQYRVEVTPFSDLDDLNENPPSIDDSEISESSLAFEAMGERSRRGSGIRRRGSFRANEHQLFLVSLYDITAERAREQAEQNAREESLLSKAMKESMVTLTHELRTPLQGIMGITSLMLEQTEYSEQQMSSNIANDNADSLGLIMASSRLLLNLINNLLDVKKANANMMDEFLLAPLLATDPIRDAIDFCNPLASISNVNISIECCDGTQQAFVNANALRLQQVLINMISNAIKYTDQGTDITIRTRPSTVKNTKLTLRKAIASYSDDELPDNTPVLIFSVTDSGPGIAMNQARRLFQRFARLSQPSRTLGGNKIGQPSGTGLGLNLCHMFVTRMRGWIWAENNAGRGSTFSFCLPLVEEPMENPALSVSTGRELQRTPMTKRASLRGEFFPLAGQDYRELRILVVDDTLINRKVLDRMLKKIGIKQVSTVESGKDALEELLSSGKAYDLVITDLQMPEMSGTELTEAILLKQEKTSSAEDRLVIIGLTADTSPDVAEKCATSGMSDVLYKPITLVEIKDFFQTKLGKLQPGQWRRQDRRGSLR